MAQFLELVFCSNLNCLSTKFENSVICKFIKFDYVFQIGWVVKNFLFMKKICDKLCFQLKQVFTLNFCRSVIDFQRFLRLLMNFHLYNYEVFVAVSFSTFQVLFSINFFNLIFQNFFA